MSAVAVVVGLLVAPAVSGAVYVDAVRRECSPRTRFLLVGAVGVVSFGGFLIPYYVRDVLLRAYLQRLKASPVLASPYEALAIELTVGTTLALVAILAYGLFSRSGPFASK